jgi:pyridoxamine 5'-phosphate oxidase
VSPLWRPEDSEPVSCGDALSTSPLPFMATVSSYQAALDRFRTVFERALQLEVHEPAAVSLATVGPGGQPSVRTVLLRGFDERGFVFHTNSQSRKGRHISENPQVALCFYWDSLKEQVLVEGVAEPLPDDESDRYWSSRHRDSRIAAWASLQSQRLENRHVLESRFDEFEAKFEGQDVSRPPHWHGYLIVPRRIEFWQGRPARMHDRIVYEQVEGGWTVYRLYP